jgi:acid phosphatase type 7
MLEAVTGSNGHVFGVRRPSHTGDYTLHGTQVRVTTFRELPPPTGPAPYRLDIKDVLSARAYDSIVKNRRLVCHFNGDIGGIGDSTPQFLVASGMEADLHTPVAGSSQTPSFLYILGDCVYFNGQVANYYQQFYGPYEHYNAPIFAVAGNHDGENVEGQVSLDGFVRAFCAPSPVHQPEAGDAPRTAMIQPNVYWTLITPVVNIVGLYSNVPEGGQIREPQTGWLISELKTLPRDVPLIVTLHHPIYSADNQHSGSTHMKELLESAATSAGRHPDMIIAGHVHDYQRLTKTLPDGSQVPYLITGAGGYPHLHPIRKVNGEKMIPPVLFDDKENDPVTLNRYSDDNHGFMRAEITPDLFTGRYYTVPRPQEPFSKGSTLIDYFEYEWRKRDYRMNQLPAGRPGK